MKHASLGLPIADYRGYTLLEENHTGFGASIPIVLVQLALPYEGLKPIMRLNCHPPRPSARWCQRPPGVNSGASFDTSPCGHFLDILSDWHRTVSSRMACSLQILCARRGFALPIGQVNHMHEVRSSTVRGSFLTVGSSAVHSLSSVP